jgi:Zinc finger, C2H2 type/Zinc-finger of C2H2 type
MEIDVLEPQLIDDATTELPRNVKQFSKDGKTSGKAAKKAAQKNISKRQQKKKKFQCSICLKLYSSRCSLRRHIESFHEKITRFTCDLCSKSFYTKGDLLVHIRKWHMLTEEEQMEMQTNFPNDHLKQSINRKSLNRWKNNSEQCKLNMSHFLRKNTKNHSTLKNNSSSEHDRNL